jgi:hypothetical protein
VVLVYGETFIDVVIGVTQRKTSHCRIQPRPLGVETGQYLLLLLSDETPRLIQFPGSVRTPTLTLLRALKAEGGDQKAKLFQFLNKIGARALRIQLGRILEMAQSSPDKQTYERKIVDRFGGQKEFEFIVAPQPEMKEAAN